MEKKDEKVPVDELKGSTNEINNSLKKDIEKTGPPENDETQDEKKEDKYADAGEKHLKIAKTTKKEASEAESKHSKKIKNKKADDELMMAEFEFSRALKIDEEHIKSLHGKGRTHLEKGEKEKAEEIFKQLATINAIFKEENRSVFNSLVADLVEQKMLDVELLKNGEIYVKEIITNEGEQTHKRYDHYRVKKETGEQFKILPILINDKAVPWEENVISVEEFNKQNFKLCSKVDHDCPCEDETKYKVKRKEAGKLSGIGEEHLNNAKEAEKEAAKAGEEPIKQEKEKEVENELLKAEDAFDRALKFDEEHVRAMYGKGKTLLGKGQKGAAEKIFRKLSTIEATFEEENRHIFNELGMDLRKLKMLDDAIDMYKKAIEIDSEAPALYVNLARVYANKQKIESTFKNLEIAIEKGEQIVVDEQHTHYEDFGRKELEKVKEIYNNFKPLKSSRKENPKDGEAKKTELDIDPDLYDNYFIV